ncbi:MAG TPA: protein kinase [Acidimicrobiales bacterium]|nr:protein kinase [Acidimicrobiales bacterium]
METTSTTAPRLLGGRYRLGPPLGRGGMADVFEAVDERLGRPVAVKMLRRPLLRNPDVRARFEQEARSAARLSHPNVVAIFDTGEDDGLPYLVMERLPGETLADRLGGPQEPEWVVRVAGDVLGALAAAHAAGVVHRDVKPGNILLGADGCAKVADFGIAKSAEAATGNDTTATGMLLGTPAYLAPERIDSQPATPQSDLYSLGIVLYEALAGRKPFEADTPLAVASAIRHAEPPALSSLRPDLDPALVAAVERAMDREPADRFSDAAEMADALGAGLAAEGVGMDATTMMATGDATTVVPVAPAAAGVRHRQSRNPVVSPTMLLGAAAVVLFILFLAMAAGRNGDDGGVDRGSLAGRIRDLAERVKVGDGPKGPELSQRLGQVASDVDAGGGSDAANRLLVDVATWHQQRQLFDTAANETIDLLRQIPGAAPPTVATTPPTTAAPVVVPPPADNTDKDDDQGEKKGRGKGND